MLREASATCITVCIVNNLDILKQSTSWEWGDGGAQTTESLVVFLTTNPANVLGFKINEI